MNLYQIEEFNRFGFINHAFLGRNGGISSYPFSSLNVNEKIGDLRENVLKNIEIIGMKFNIDLSKIITINQVHGNRVFIFNNDYPSLNEGFDGIITTNSGFAISVKTADCLPIIFLDPNIKAIGIAHAGWRGTELGIAENMINELINRFGCKPVDIIAGLGPSISPCCYNRDLKKENIERLINRGVPPKNIYHIDLCTSCNKDIFFSYQGDNRLTGRQLNFIFKNFP